MLGRLAKLASSSERLRRAHLEKEAFVGAIAGKALSGGANLAAKAMGAWGRSFAKSPINTAVTTAVVGTGTVGAAKAGRGAYKTNVESFRQAAAGNPPLPPGT